MICIGVEKTDIHNLTKSINNLAVNLSGSVDNLQRNQNALQDQIISVHDKIHDKNEFPEEYTGIYETE